MISQNYDKIVERICRETGLDVQEINRRVDAKRAKLSDLISKEGAAQVVAVELGVNFDKPEVKINEILSGMRKITLKGKIIKAYPVRVFKTQTGEGKVENFVLADETGNIKCVLWDTNHIKLFEDKALKEGDIVELKNASVREPAQDVLEVHVGSYGEIKLSDAKMENVITRQEVLIKKISELQENNTAKVRAVIVQIYEPRFFNVCPECGGKVTQEEGKFICIKHGSIIPKERFVLSIVIDDGTGNIRASCFSETAEKIIGDAQKLKDANEFFNKKKMIVGQECFFTGRTRKNVMYDSLDFVVNDVETAEPDEVIKMLKAA